MNAIPINLKSGALVSAVGVFASAFLWLLGFKVVAYWMGPEGVGLFSQLRQIAQAATIGATFGGTNPVVQGLSERFDGPERLAFRATVSRVMLATGAIVALTILAAAPVLTQFFLSSAAPDLIVALRFLALAVLLSVGATYALAVLNGYHSFAYLALAQIAGPAALVALLGVLWLLGLPPAPQLLATAFVFCFGATCIMGALGVSRLPGSVKSAAPASLNVAQTRSFISFALSNMVAALSASGALLLIRSWVIEANGLAFAGLFDAGWTLTFNYTTILLTACSVIYLPLLTAALDSKSQKACMLKTAYLVLGASLLVCYSMVLCKEFLINLLYSPQFQDSGQVLMVLVIAVIFRGVSWVYGTMILATRDSRVLLVSDLALNLLLLILVRCALDNHVSLAALGWAFVIANFFYLVFVVEYAHCKNKLMHRRLIWPFLALGALPLFYLALAPEWLVMGYVGYAKWLCTFVGWMVGIAALRAGFKVPQ